MANIADGLAECYPDLAEQLQQNAEAYCQELQALKQEGQEKLAQLKTRDLIEIGTKSRFHENNALQRNGLANGQAHYTTGRTKKGGFYTMKMRKAEDYRNEIKSYIVRAGMTMSELIEILADEYGWSASVPNLSGKLRRGSLRYGEAVELADALGYDIVWQKRRG